MGSLIRAFLSAVIGTCVLFSDVAAVCAQSAPPPEFAKVQERIEKIFRKSSIVLEKADVAVADGRKDYRFQVTMKFDPRTGPNTKFYNRLYLELSDVLGRAPVTLVDRQDNLIIKLHWPSKTNFVVDMEEFE